MPSATVSIGKCSRFTLRGNRLELPPNVVRVAGDGRPALASVSPKTRGSAGSLCLLSFCTFTFLVLRTASARELWRRRSAVPGDELSASGTRRECFVVGFPDSPLDGVPLFLFSRPVGVLGISLVAIPIEAGDWPEGEVSSYQQEQALAELTSTSSPVSSSLFPSSK